MLKNIKLLLALFDIPYYWSHDFNPMIESYWKMSMLNYQILTKSRDKSMKKCLVIKSIYLIH